ncbi:sugar phosphate nucleotidyltransferase [Streptomyces sp. NPDC001073]
MRHKVPQTIVLAGGLGSRLGDAGQQCPKIMQPVAGRPFLDFMLQPLIDRGIHRYLFCLGHLADPVVDHLRQRWPDLDVAIHIDTTPRGTAGALLTARELLDDVFLVVLGDTYLDMDYLAMTQELTPDLAGVMAVSGAVGDVPGNVEVEEKRVARYHKCTRPHSHPWVDTGVLLLRREALGHLVATDEPLDLGGLFEKLIEQGALGAYEVNNTFYDIGTPARLSRFNLLMHQTEMRRVLTRQTSQPK